MASEPVVIVLINLRAGSFLNPDDTISSRIHDQLLLSLFLLGHALCGNSFEQDLLRGLFVSANASRQRLNRWPMHRFDKARLSGTGDSRSFVHDSRN
jgi:hypothetical protein